MNVRDKVAEIEAKIDGLTDRAIEQGYLEGKRYERERIVNVLKSKQCFDFSSGMCEHSACYLAEELIRDLEKANGE